MLVSVLHRVGDVDLTVDVTDAERSESGWQRGRIDEAALINLIKAFVVGFHRAGPEISHKKKIVTVGHTHRGTLVNRTRIIRSTIIHGNEGVGGIKHRVPSRDGAIFRYKNEGAWGC